MFRAPRGSAKAPRRPAAAKLFKAYEKPLPHEQGGKLFSPKLSAAQRSKLLKIEAAPIVKKGTRLGHEAVVRQDAKLAGARHQAKLHEAGLGGIAARAGLLGGELAQSAKAIPGGIYAAGKAGVEDTGAATHGDLSFKRSRALGEAMGKQVGSDLRHPYRHPGFTFVDLLTLGSAGAGALGKLGAAGDAARVGDLGGAAKALAKRPPIEPRLIEHNGLTVPLQASGNSLVRGVQEGHDMVIRRALKTNPESRIGSYATKRLAGSLDETRRYREAMQKVPALVVEHGGRKLNRAEQMALRLTSEQTTPGEAIRFHEQQHAKGIEPKAQLKQIKLLKQISKRGLVTLDESKPAGEQVQIDAAVHPRLAAIDKQLASASAERDQILKDTGQMSAAGLKERVDAPGRVRAGAESKSFPSRKARVEQVREYPGKIVTRERPRTRAEAERRLAQIDAANEEIVQRMAAPGSALGKGETARRNVINNRVAYFKRTGKTDLPGMSKALRAGAQRTVREEALAHAQRHLDEFAAKHPNHPVVRAYLRRVDEGNHLRELLNSPEDLFAEKPPEPDFGKLTETVARPGRRVHLKEQTAQKGGTAIVGGEGARPGRNYVPYYATEKRAGRAAATASPGEVIGKVQGLVPKSKTFTGKALEQGKVPPNTTGLVSRQLARAYKYANTDEFRRTIAKAGSQTRKTSRDVLVNTQELKNAKVPDELRAQLSGGTLTADELSGHASAFDAWRQHIVPGVADRFKAEARVPLETAAPKGYLWVDRNLLGELGHASHGAPGRVARAADTVNSAATAATVYYKLGHIATRAGTNFVANLIQGSAHPDQLARSVRLWRSLSTKDRLRALGAAGEGGLHALPHEAENVVGTVARRGSGWWSKHVDAPFRFNSLAYEARKAGYRTPADFQRLLNDLQDPSQLSPAEAAKVDRVAKRANREAIAYNRLNETEKRYLRRAVWFYPWISGSTRFAANTILEHPLKAAGLVALGREGEQRRQQELGALPDYAAGLFKVGGSKALPRVADFSTVSPFRTPAEVTDSLIHLDKPTESEQLSAYLNPALSAASRVAFHLDAYGRPSTGSTLHNVASGLGATTPEATLLAALRQSKSAQSKRMYRQTTKDALLRFALGSEMPRTLNRQVGNAQAKKEASAAMSPEGRARASVTDKRKEYLDAAKKAGLLPKGATSQPAPVKRAFDLRATLYVAYAKAGAKTTGERFTVENQLLLRLGKITPAQAKKGEAWAKTANDKDLASFRRELRDRFFGARVLEAATRQINAHGGNVRLG